MNLKKLDNRIRTLIENGVVSGHRSMFVIVGDKGRDQIVILHHILSKTIIRTRPTVLWCYKKELGFSSHRKKQMKKLQKKIQGGNVNINEDDPFELFVAATNIRYSYYSETHKILGNTFGMCVLQDFEALTPNLLARTIETVEGGGIIVILLRSMTSLKQLYTMSMDVHSRYRTEAHSHIVGRFNERFILSLAVCRMCLITDDQLTILPLSSHSVNIIPLPQKAKDELLRPREIELKELKESLQDTQPVGALVNLSKTVDQAKALLQFIEAISEKTLRTTVVLTAARGRGKSAALGLAMAAAVAFGYSNIFVTSPSPENLKTLFEFIFKGFDVLEYQEHLDYDLIQSTNPEFNKAVVRVNIFKEHRQTIQYIHPSDSHKLGQSELVVIDEAAAIPLPLVKNLFGPYLVFMSSTVNGYEGTGRSLSLKLINQLRQQASSNQGMTAENKAIVNISPTGRKLYEVELQESIRYQPNDPIEKWLNDLLCLDTSALHLLHTGCPPPQDCDLYYVNRDTLFCFHKASEAFLQRLVSLFVASHYKNSPNDLQMISDAPAHHLFCLLGPVDPTKNVLPEVLCAVQICLEGEISKSSIIHGLSKGQRSSGDLIPWTLSQQFQDNNFPHLSGARIVRIATHPEYQNMGYGSKCLELLQKYYEGKIPNLHEQEIYRTVPVVDSENINLLEEKLGPRQNLLPLLAKLSERPAEKLDYLGVSFGLTSELLRFWKKSGYIPVYLRQTPNDLTAEHSCIMLKLLNMEEKTDSWLSAFWTDFRRRFISLLSYNFSTFKPSFALNVLENKFETEPATALTKAELDIFMSSYDINRLELYSHNMADYHLIIDLLPTIARLYFLNKLNIHISPVQSAILLGMGLQHRSADDCAKELDLATTQVLGLFNRIIRKVIQTFKKILEEAIEDLLVSQKSSKAPINEELSVAEFQKKHEKENVYEKYSIPESEESWQNVLKDGSIPTIVSIPSERKEKRKHTQSPKPPKIKKKKKFK